MKKILIVLLAVAVVLIIGICIWKNIHKEDKLCSVTYCSYIGYSLSMTVDEEQVTVTYIDRDKEPIVKKADISCYTNILGIMDEYDFTSWSHLSDKKAETAGFNTLEIKYNSGKTYFFSQSQELPEKVLMTFSDVNSCLLEYAGICK